MRESLENPDNTPTTLVATTGALALVPVAVWLFAPVFTPFALIFALGCQLSLWRSQLAPFEDLSVHTGADLQPPRGRAAALVRVRLAVFGATTMVPGMVGMALMIDRDPVSPGIVLLLAAVAILAIPAAILSTHATLWLLSLWRFVSDIPLDALSIWIAVTKRGEARKAAHQQLYALENRFYVAVAGYPTTFIFRADSVWLRENLPPVGRFP